jgi:hypothetical protein
MIIQRNYFKHSQLTKNCDFIPPLICNKTFYVRNLQIFEKGLSVRHLQAFQAQSNVGAKARNLL